MAFDNPLASEIWSAKYRFVSPDAGAEPQVEDTWRRIAQATAQAERPELREAIAERFYRALEGHRFLPAGRIIAGVGSGRAVTLFNCFVMGAIPDVLGGIFEHVREAACPPSAPMAQI